MEIEKSLALTNENKNRVCFIQSSGLFCKLYNQSAYIVIELLQNPLNIYVKRLKIINNQPLIISGFPIKSILKFFPTAKKTAWGFELIGNFDLSSYNIWSEKVIKNYTPNPTFNNQSKPQSKVKSSNHNIENIINKELLTPQHIAFLSTWEKGKYPFDVDMGFLENLKQHLINKNII